MEKKRGNKKNWKLLQGYVYCMSKKFRPFPEDPERLLIKIGHSDFEADDGRDKYLQRLQTHKTSLISLKVYRICLYTDGGASTLKGKLTTQSKLYTGLLSTHTIHHQSGLHLTKKEQTEHDRCWQNSDCCWIQRSGSHYKQCGSSRCQSFQSKGPKICSISHQRCFKSFG